MSEKPRKLQRVSKACDFCNRRSTRCGKSEDPLGRCQNCADFDVPCTYDRPTKRRGIKAGSKNHDQDTSYSRSSVDLIPNSRMAASGSASGSSGSRSSIQQEACFRPSGTGDPWTSFNTGWSTSEGYDDDGALRNSWKAFGISSDQQIKNLVQVYFEIGLFASTMAVCALASGRARDGALYSSRWRREELIEPPSEAFYAAAKDTFPRDLALARGFNYMRTCAILAIASIQNGQIKNLQKYSGMYHTLTTVEGLHDEKLWPKDIGIIETEERRRLFWSIYTLDVYASIVWGGIIRYREAHSLVRYPSELDDEYISDRGYDLPQVSPTPQKSGPGDAQTANGLPVSWIHGWNFTTDLYRILEHVADGTRRRFSTANGTIEVWSMFSPASMSEPIVMERVLSMYAALPPQFRETRPTTGDINQDLFGFPEIGVDRKCDVAGELLSAFSKVPVEYLKAISSPLLHHLGGIGYILDSVMEGSLSDESYCRVRTLLLEMADLLHRLDSNLHSSAGTSQRPRAQVECIDGYMRASRLVNFSAAPLPASNDAVNNPQRTVKAESLVSPGMYTRTVYPSMPASTSVSHSMMQFQLPPGLLTDWPWPLDNSHSETFLPLAFE
ncbi:Fungal Zn(2)-Cys(6) binuclear cluster domain-containing protein [Penicillium ucsense]|uniref:Fungal Zn(2)-Cys(6) binuclear cluster domain-containing protein n=1 Tax=Penicillium ucsense TaxID=2839758 RepID=A0A8J8WGZ8_9EURO|nr:Fungal Zn(2)-Cys(6) binuclear cluster domain-containing protein [Penicillium ucsense]KAF7734015.1 Fungal Zn(2)-Cys(6) binuclear cluster domain-containing protein [Penicillium ucsense]